MCFLFNGNSLPTEADFVRNVGWFQSFVSGKGLFQLVLRWERLVSAHSATFGWFRVVPLFSNYRPPMLPNEIWISAIKLFK